MMQFKDRVYREKLSQSQVVMPSQTVSLWIAKDFLEIQCECPQSSIVFGEEPPDYKSMVKEIYTKYIEEGATYEITVEYAARKRLTNLIDNDHWAMNEEYENPLKL